MFATGVASYEWDKSSVTDSNSGSGSRSNNLNDKTNELNLKSEEIRNRILLPMKGSVLIYDNDIQINSERLKMIYDQNSGLNSEINSNKNEKKEKEMKENEKKENAALPVPAPIPVPAIDPQLSPLGNTIAFVLNKDLYVQHVRASASSHEYGGM